jgi:hypothetical protein
MQTAPRDNRFAFDIECDVFEKARPDGGTGRYIGGFVSTEHMDRQGETLIQKGLDFDPFLTRGWFNDNHDSTTDALVGYPTNATLRKTDDGREGWYVEGELLEGDGTSRADRLWKLAQDLKKTEGKRKLGFSVEGKILDRDPKNPKLVRKAEVHEVAITRCPVNTRTSLDVLAKSLAVSTPAGEAGSAEPLQPEALEGTGKKKKKRKIKKSAAVELLRMIKPQLPPGMAERIVEYAARHHAAA